MAIVIKKRVDLGFLGVEYKKAYLVFRSLPISEYDKFLTEFNAIQDDNQKTVNNLRLMIRVLKDSFLSGEFPDEEGKLQKVEPEDLNGLDQESLVKCFETFTGQVDDPNLKAPSTTPSSTEPAPQMPS